MKESAGRVIIIIQNLPAPFDRRVWLEANTLKNAGYDVTIICPKMMQFTKPYEVIDGIKIHRYRLFEAKRGHLSYAIEFGYCLIRTFMKVLRIAFTDGFDIIHACNPPDTFFLIAGLCKPFGKKFVFDEHDLCPEVYLSKSADFKKDVTYSILLMLEKLTYRTADVVLSMNESYKAAALERGKLEDDKVFIVRTGPDFDRLREVPAVESLKHGRKHLVVYLGTMGEQDGVDYLLQSAEYIVKEKGIADIHFALIGDGVFKERLVEMRDEMGLNDYVEFTGRISDEELVKYLNTADCCACPDPKNPLNDVSTMNKTMEYMALGKPVVAFDLKETRFSAQDAALYATPNDTVEFAECILELLDDEDKRRQMGEYGKARVKKELAWDHTSKELLKAYESLK